MRRMTGVVSSTSTTRTAPTRVTRVTSGQLATSSASYSVWLYAHRMTKDSLLHVQTEFVGPKLRHEDGKLASLRQTAGSSPTAS